MYSSTPASAAMAAAVNGLSPVIITVRIPMARISLKRSALPGLTVSLRCTTPTHRRPSATRRGVPPPRPMRSTTGPASSGTVPPCSSTQRRTESTAPLRIERLCHSTPLIRVCAVKGTSVASSMSTRPSPYRWLTRSTIERPSGVSSARLDRSTTSARARSSSPPTGISSEAMRLPWVIVPVLSRSSVETSPAASTARPDMASTLRCTSRSMPAMPIAERRPPIVVGARQTSRPTSTMID
jgi:hypothetical protein